MYSFPFTGYERRAALRLAKVLLLSYKPAAAFSGVPVKHDLFHVSSIVLVCKFALSQTLIRNYIAETKIGQHNADKTKLNSTLVSDTFCKPTMELRALFLYENVYADLLDEACRRAEWQTIEKLIHLDLTPMQYVAMTTGTFEWPLHLVIECICSSTDDVLKSIVILLNEDPRHAMLMFNDETVLGIAMNLVSKWKKHGEAVCSVLLQRGARLHPMEYISATAEIVDSLCRIQKSHETMQS